jgi:hypothetical protein
MESRRPGNSHVRFGKRRNETDRREPTRRVAPTSPWLSEPATIAVSMAIKRPQEIDDAPVRAGAQRRMAGQRLSCLREEWAKPRGRKSQRRHCGKAIEAQPFLWPGRVIDETASSRARRPAGKVMRPWDHARAGVAVREIANLAHAKAPRIPEPCPAEKCSLRRCSVRRYRRALSHRRANSAFTAMTADTAEHHPTDDGADDSIPDDVAFRTIGVVHEGKSEKRACRTCWRNPEASGDSGGAEVDTPSTSEPGQQRNRRG